MTTDTRAEFEAAYIAHLKQQWPLNKCTPQDLAVMREGDGYGDGASHLTGAWWGWKAASVLCGEAVGEASAMPGTDGFTMACFRADDVPLGTPLFVRPVPSATPVVPANVMAALDRMCTPLHESRLSGATAEADAHSMKLIRDYVLSTAPAQASDTVYRVLADLLSYAEQNVCMHENTHRGGAIWEVCDGCGAQWADDTGGKPEFEWPKAISAARAVFNAIASAPAQSCAENPTGLGYDTDDATLDAILAPAQSCGDALIAQHGFCLDEDQCTCARELGYRVCQPNDHTSPIGEDAANGAMGERGAFGSIHEFLGIASKRLYPTPDKPNSDWAKLRAAVDALALLEARAALSAEKVAAEPVIDTHVNLVRPSTGDVFKALRTDSCGIRELLREGWQIAPQPERPTQADTAATGAPFPTCRFKLCDLPGQCRGEGKCHHPAVPAAQPTQAAMLSDAQRIAIEAAISISVDIESERHDGTFLSDESVRALRALLAASAGQTEQEAATLDDSLPQSAMPAWRDVVRERRRQIAEEGWTPEHDDVHTDGSLAVAGACYALVDARDTIGGAWPWDFRWWKPTTQRRNLIKAAALILAEIERIDRAAAKGSGNAE